MIEGSAQLGWQLLRQSMQKTVRAQTREPAQDDA